MSAAKHKISKKSGGVSIQHAIIERANNNTVITVAVAVFISMFCVFAIRTLYSQMSFQNKVISAKEDAVKTLKDDQRAVSQLSENYQTFDQEKINILDGSSDGKGPRDGRNGKLVMDALPASLDIPALASSFEKILVDGGYKIENIGGSQESIQSSSSSIGSNLSEAQYRFSVDGSSKQAESLMERLESSIRPIYVDGIIMDFSESGSVETSYDIRTFYAEAVEFDVRSKEVK